jgi:heptosyltransferase I
VALLKTAAIGDTVLLSAIIRDLSQQGIRVTVFVGSSNYEFAKLIKQHGVGIERVEKLPLTKPWLALKKIRAQKFDVMIDFDAWPRISALLAGLSCADYKIGFRTAGQNRHYLFDADFEHRADQHEIENYRSLVKLIGFSSHSEPQDLSHPWHASDSKPQIIFHLWPGGTQSQLKEWVAPHWQSLAQEILKIGDFSFVLTGAPVDRERSEAFIQNLPADLRLKFQNSAGLSLQQTLQLLQESCLLVSVNTGIMHVGAALGLPTVGLHGPTNPLRWGPLGSHARAVLSESPGAGTLNLGFEYQHQTDYMKDLTVEKVLMSCRELLLTIQK